MPFEGTGGFVFGRTISGGPTRSGCTPGGPLSSATARLRNAYPGRSADNHLRHTIPQSRTRSRTRQSDAQAAGPAIPEAASSDTKNRRYPLRTLRKPSYAATGSKQILRSAGPPIIRERTSSEQRVRMPIKRFALSAARHPHGVSRIRLPTASRQTGPRPPCTGRRRQRQETRAPGPPPKTSADDRAPTANPKKATHQFRKSRPCEAGGRRRGPGTPKTSADDRARPDGQKRKKGIPSERDTLGLLCGDAPIRPSRRQPSLRFRPLRRGIRPAAPRAPSANRARAPARPWHRPAPGCPNCPCP